MAAGFGERQRVEDFARLLDSLGSPGTEPGAGVATLEHPEGSRTPSAHIPSPRAATPVPSDPELAAMLRAVEAVVDHGRRRAPEVRPRFREELGLRLQAEFLQLFDADVDHTDRTGGDPPGRHHRAVAASWRRRLISGGVVVGVLSGGAGGVAWAASSALPGDPLYPVKRGLENIRTSFSGSDSDRGEQYLGQARTRLSEIEKLLDRKDANVDGTDSSRLIDGTMDNLYGDVGNAGRLLIPLAAQGDTGALDALSGFLAAEEPPVGDLQVLLAPESQDKARRLLALMQSYDEQLTNIRRALANHTPTPTHPDTDATRATRSQTAPTAQSSGSAATSPGGDTAGDGDDPGAAGNANPTGPTPTPSSDPTLSLQVPIGSSPSTVVVPPLLSGLPPIGITIGGAPATGPTSATAPPDTDPNPN